MRSMKADIGNAIAVVAILKDMQQRGGKIKKMELEAARNFNQHSNYMNTYGLITEINENGIEYVAITDFGKKFIPNTTLVGFLSRKIKDYLR